MTKEMFLKLRLQGKLTFYSDCFWCEVYFDAVWGELNPCKSPLGTTSACWALEEG